MKETEITSGAGEGTTAPEGAKTGTATSDPGGARPGNGATATGTATGDPGGAAPAKGAKAKVGTGGQGAVARATARRAAADTAAAGTGGTQDPLTHAKGPSAGRGDTPPPADMGDAGEKANDGTAAAGAEGGTQSPTGSTVTAPDDWPEENKARFAALPNDDARSMFLDSYKDMARQFTESMQNVARLRKDHDELIRTVEAHGVDAAEANRVLAFSAEFAKNPRQVLQQLAAQAKIEVFFDRPLAKGEMPEFKDPKEMAEYIRQQTLDAVRAEREAADAAAAETRALEDRKQQLRADLKNAAEKFGEGFAKSRTAVMERMLQALSIEDAYSLVTLPALRKQAEEGAQAKQALAAAKAELEAIRKRATQPPAGVRANGEASPDERRLSAGERAVKRAISRKAAASHA